MLETLSNRILVVGGHPFRICFKHPSDEHRRLQTSNQPEGPIVVCCCKTDSPLYSRCWPLLFLFSAITDFPLPLPHDRRPGQHRDWGWMPVVVVLSIIAFIYYGYLDQVCFMLIHQGKVAQATVYLVPLHIWLVLLLASYARVVLMEPGSPKKAMMDRVQYDARTKPPYGSILPQRWCDSCGWWKPDRAHHCRVCDVCVLRMDHHCPWVNGCVGFANYRYFIQFVCYASGLAAWVFTTSLAAFIMGNGLATYNGVVIAILILTGFVMISIGTFACAHLWLLTLNRTTIENIQFRAWNKRRDRPPPSAFTNDGKNVFNQGTRVNWKELMGEHWWQWILPISVDLKCNGYEFNFNEDTRKELNNDEASCS